MAINRVIIEGNLTRDVPATPYEPSHAAPAPVPEPELDLYDEDIPF